MPEKDTAVNGSAMEVSVIVHVRNAQRTLPRCLRALLNQSILARKSMEVIVLDSGSSDRTFEIALEFKRQNPEFVQIHRLASADQNTGLVLARGKYIAFWCVDDIVTPGIVEALVAACEEKKLDFSGRAGAYIWDKTLQGMLVRKEFLLTHDLPVKTGYDLSEQLAAYDTRRVLVRPAQLPVFCARWVETLRALCLEEYRKCKGGAAFYGWMITLAEKPQVMETMALAERGSLHWSRRKFFNAFRARDWIALEKNMKWAARAEKRNFAHHLAPAAICQK